MIGIAAITGMRWVAPDDWFKDPLERTDNQPQSDFGCAARAWCRSQPVQPGLEFASGMLEPLAFADLDMDPNLYATGNGRVTPEDYTLLALDRVRPTAWFVVAVFVDRATEHPKLLTWNYNSAALYWMLGEPTACSGCARLSW